MTEKEFDQTDFRQLRSEVAELRDDVRELIDAWKAAKGLVYVVRSLAALAVACAALWSAFKLGHR